VDSYGTHRRGSGESSCAGQEEPLGFREPDALFFSRAEAQIALLRRCQPTNGPAAAAAWVGAFRRGERAELRLHHAPPPDLEQLEAALRELESTLGAAAGLAALYVERVRELRLDAELARSVGTPHFHRLARRRHAPSDAPEWAAAEQLARAWAQASCPPDPAATYRSDHRHSPHSLLSLLTREIGQRRLPVRVELAPLLASRAASGDGVVFIQPNLALTHGQGLRICQHEILGHVLPRVLARSQACGLFRVGSAGAGDEEEGRALLIEERSGSLDGERRRELGLRHLAALAVCEGADVTECVRLLLGLGCTLPDAAALYLRVARGGGLCRELAYLPAWLRSSAAFELDPGLERWLEHGRLSLSAARALREAGIVPVANTPR
jgi:hypothetical protein